MCRLTLLILLFRSFNGKFQYVLRLTERNFVKVKFNKNKIEFTICTIFGRIVIFFAFANRFRADNVRCATAMNLDARWFYISRVLSKFMWLSSVDCWYDSIKCQVNSLCFCLQLLCDARVCVCVWISFVFRFSWYYT